ncbi:MAG: beta-galactosidase [Spirochaetes bacterium]|nr:beta-galactosidase [Spirochaetota bacterium]
MKRHSPIHPSVKRLLHGGDYNPDQWLHMPEIIREDFRLMPLAHCNTMSVAIFAWTALEPEEGRFTFDWLDDIMGRLEKGGHHAILATPSGARPAWLAQKYPEVLRVTRDRHRNLFGVRHNHCFTSPVYREKVALMNGKLAERYGKHPATVLWHLSNEYGGDCHCPLCQDAFRAWLKKRFGGDLDALNRAWYTAFWSHTYTDWSQVESPSPRGEWITHGHNLDWRRFVTHQTADFIRAESAPLRRLAPGIPITTNLMSFYDGLNYWEISKDLDLVTWDNYPTWHKPGEQALIASKTAMAHDLNRGLKQGKPFLLMESSPGPTNWQPVGRLRKPGMHKLASLQAVAHGSDSVLYFQYRKSRGSSEKLHGAVVDHLGTEHGRMFKEVGETGALLEKVAGVIGCTTGAKAAVVYDWENRWAIDDAKGPRNDGLKRYLEECEDHHRALWRLGIACDVIDQTQPLDGYALVIAPMSYMVRPGFAERLEAFVAAGGTLVTGFFSGIVDEHDLVHLGGWPGPLRKLTGVWAEEIDALYPEEENAVVMGKNPLGLKGPYRAHTFCDLIHAETAQVLAVYGNDFYAGRPAVTVNRFGAGDAWYLAARTDFRFLAEFYEALSAKLALPRAVAGPLPEGVSAALRGGGDERWLFLMNYNERPEKVDIGPEKWRDVEKDALFSGKVFLAPLGIRVFRRGFA